MADQPMLARRQIRLAALAALSGAAFAGVAIDSPGDWATPSEALPAILLRATDDRKEAISRGQPDFTTTVTLELEVRVGAANASAAQDKIEALCYSIETALLTNYALISIINQVTSYDTRMEISSDGKIHFGGAKITINFELPEMFDPFAVTLPPDLITASIHVDMLAPFDATGTYANPPFPAAIVTAPRTSGPDGRDEGVLLITLPQ